MNQQVFNDLSRLYSAVYNEDLREEVEVLNDSFYGAENLSEDHLEEIMEELVSEIVAEGIEVDELDEVMEAVLLELNPYASAGSKEAKAYNKATTASKRSAERDASRAATVAKVKDAAQSAVGAVQSKAGEVAGAVTGAVKSAKQQSHIGLAKYASGRNLMPGAGLKTQSSSGRGQLRAAVTRDIASRVKGKIARAGEKISSAVQSQGEKAKASAQAASERAAARGAAVKGAASAAKAGVKKGIRGAALGLARRMREEVEPMDLYAIVFEHLISEGYASTEEGAHVIMANMSEAWIESIVEG
jgi:hypothetical protein